MMSYCRTSTFSASAARRAVSVTFVLKPTTIPFDAAASMRSLSVTSPAASPDTLVITMKKKYAPIYTFGLTQGLVPMAATEASYAKFVTGSRAVDAAAVKALADRISTAQGGDVCAGAAPPDTCNVSTYTADIEAILAIAGVTLPDKARFVGTDGTLDTGAYAAALVAHLTD